MSHLVAGLAFGGLVVGSAALALQGGDPDRQRRWVSAFVLYVLAVSFTAGLTHRDLWPFSSWQMMTVPPPAEVGPGLPFSWIYGVAEDGREIPVDPRALEPISMSELLAWLEYRLEGVPPERRRRIGALLLAKANEGRAAVRAGGQPGGAGRLLGPLGAPRHLLFRSSWRAPDDVPATPFTALRWYRETWDIERRRGDPGAVTRTLGFEYRP